MKNQFANVGSIQIADLRSLRWFVASGQAQEQEKDSERSHYFGVGYKVQKIRRIRTYLVRPLAALAVPCRTSVLSAVLPPCHRPNEIGSKCILNVQRSENYNYRVEWVIRRP